MKRTFSIVLIIMILLSCVPLHAASVGFGTNINVIKSPDKWTDTDGKMYSTVIVEYRLRGEGIAGIQGAWIAIDAEKLLWVDYTEDEISVRDAINDGTIKKGESSVRFDYDCMYSLKPRLKDGLKVVDEWSFGTFSFNSVALSSDGRTMYLGTQPMQKSTVSYSDYVTVVSFRFAVLTDAGVDGDDVRLITEAERGYLNQSFIAAMSDGAYGYYYGNKSGTDNLAKPTLTGDFITNEPTGGEDDTEERETYIPNTNPGEDEASKPENEWKNPFRDVEEGADYYDAVRFVYENGLFKGTSATEFEPDTTMTRAMFVTVLGRLYGIDEKKYKGAAFDDVVEGEWYAPYVKWAAEKKIVEGYGDGMFGVEDEVTIEQAVVILARYASATGVDITSKSGLGKFKDYKQVSAWAVLQMKWAVERGVYSGMGNLLRPQTPARRGLVAQLFHAYVEIIE